MSQHDDQTTPETTDERTLRRAKRQAMIDAGGNPYPSSFEPDAHAARSEEDYASLEPGQDTEDVVCVAGRVRAIRNQGKVCFVMLQDHTGQIQLFFRVNNLEPAVWDLLGTVDLGDIVGVTGTVLRTRRGQISVAPTSLTMLAKALRPLPEKFHGLSDKETRYRQRYADMIVNPEVLETFKKRSRMIAAIRRYMDGQGYFEVETPILQYTLGGANARPFVTHQIGRAHV